MSAPKQQPHVSIVVLNYRGVADTLDCLESLQELDYPNVDIIVVDNASGDGSVEALKKSSLDFHLIESPQNLGYSAGNNLAIQHVLDNLSKRNKRAAESQLPGYIWILNNDTTVGPSSLTHMVKEALRTGGLVGPLVLYPDKTYQQVGTRIGWRTGKTVGYPESSLKDGMAVDCLTGASMLIPVQAFQQLGLLDESYFLYFEDAEFCLRAREKKYPITVAIQARVYHKEGASTGKKSLQTQYYYHRNRMKLLSEYALGAERLTIHLYAFFRLCRSVVKSWFSPEPDKRQSAHVHWLAYQDYQKGRDGQCPHNLATTNA